MHLNVITEKRPGVEPGLLIISYMLILIILPIKIALKIADTITNTTMVTIRLTTKYVVTLSGGVFIIGAIPMYSKYKP